MLTSIVPMKPLGVATCPRTGITVPECSCVHCLEDQLRRFQPRLLRAQIKVIRRLGESIEQQDRRAA
jgi:hypothetical protein